MAVACRCGLNAGGEPFVAFLGWHTIKQTTATFQTQGENHVDIARSFRIHLRIHQHLDVSLSQRLKKRFSNSIGRMLDL